MYFHKWNNMNTEPVFSNLGSQCNKFFLKIVLKNLFVKIVFLFFKITKIDLLLYLNYVINKQYNVFFVCKNK